VTPSSLALRHMRSRTRTTPTKVPVPPVRGKDEARRIVGEARLDAGDRSAPNRAHLGTAFRIGEANKLLRLADPLRFERQGFHLPEPGQQHQSDRCQAGRVLTLRFRLTHRFPQLAKLVIAQAPLASFAGELPNALRRIAGDNLQSNGMAKKAPRGSHRTARGARTTSRDATSAFPSVRRLAGDNVRLHSFDVHVR